MLIEQAIFTSAKTVRFDGYQLVACSRGVSEEDSRELAVWGPSHGALCEARDEASSVNFHRLTSGVCCVSKTVAAGEEFSGRGGARIYTQYLLVPSEVFARFANNPFAVLRAAWAKGLLNVHERVPTTLEQSSLVGRSAIVDEGLLAQLADQWGPERVGRLVAAVVNPGQVLLTGASHCETLLGGLVNCFPAECRTDLSFTTGLLPSPRRPFRLVPSDLDAAERRRAARQPGVQVLDLSVVSIDDEELPGWARYVSEAIASDQLTRLTHQLQTQRMGLRLEELDGLGEELIHELHAVSVGCRSIALRETIAPISRSTTETTCNIRRDLPAKSAKSNVVGRSEQRESQKSARRGSRSAALAGGAATSVDTIDDPVAIELLEQLDDTVYDTINGASENGEKLAKLWSLLAGHLPPETLATTREQYLRYTLNLWEARVAEGVREPEKAIRALDVLMVLFHAE